MIHFNVVDHTSQGVCKTVRTTFKFIIVLLLRGEGPEKAHNYGTDLENNNTFKSSSDSFAHTLRYVVNVENFQN